jgi:diguanylate cyclase (GGDEF)-like protein
VGRLGGDEFAVVMPRCDAGYGLSKAAKMGQAIARLVLDWEGQRIPLAASVGLASFTGQEQATALLAEADAEMYRDKRAVKGAA